MCIIVFKPRGVKILEKKLLENCFDSNSDGAGFCTVEDGEVVGVKGFDTFEELYELVVEIPDEFPVIMHFRLATHGATDASATHPFPVSSDEEDLKALYWRAQLGVAHNGVITGFGKSATRYIKNKKQEDPGLSDTQDFIIRVLSQLNEKSLWKRKVKKTIAKMTSSKFACMNSSGDVSLIGGFVQEKGHHFSNRSYEGKSWTIAGWDWEEEWYNPRSSGYVCSTTYRKPVRKTWSEGQYKFCPYFDRKECGTCDLYHYDTKRGWLCWVEDDEREVVISEKETRPAKDDEAETALVELYDEDRLKCGLC